MKEDHGAMVADLVGKMRAGGGPLVHCITNYVSMDIMANILLAAGMSPAMVHAEAEAPEFAGISSAVSINVGTLVRTIHVNARCVHVLHVKTHTYKGFSFFFAFHARPQLKKRKLFCIY